MDTAKGFARVGDTVGLSGREFDADLRAALHGTGVKLHENDLSKPQDQLIALKHFSSENGGPNALVFFQRVRDIDANLEYRFRVEVDATARIVEAASLMSPMTLSAVVVATSPAASKVLADQPFGYHATKAALSAFVRWGASRYGPLGIRINAVSPSSVIFKERARIFYESNPALLEKLNKPVPLRRMGTTKEIFDVVNFLVKPESSFISGQTIEIDGGVGNLDWHQLVADR
jgi:NAD(P)-dependent dehydrogenase (short-subunit alcohol dehydrogenase family)